MAKVTRTVAVYRYKAYTERGESLVCSYGKPLSVKDMKQYDRIILESQSLKKFGMDLVKFCQNAEYEEDIISGSEGSVD